MINLWHQKSQIVGTSCTSKFLFVVSLLNSHDNYGHSMSSHALHWNYQTRKKTVFNWKSILKSVILILEIRLDNKKSNLHILFLSYRHKVNRNLLCMDSYLLQCIPIWIQFHYIHHQNENERRVGWLKMFG